MRFGLLGPVQVRHEGRSLALGTGRERFVLAMLLGASRPTVSGIIEDFRRRGIVAYERGRIIVASGERLLLEACDCYAIIRENYLQVGR